MSYIVFARKWRPKTFEEVIGQEHITTTLKNAIEQNRVAHAYLFCGPRGTGKTTTARLLAKALNCEKGPIALPCNKCISCIEIIEGKSLDIIEIDAASNRGIDEIRNLRESARFSPQQARFKIYIIDEVHMLTPEAFNALLKTLEEPPAHIKFVFATTALHKVPPTIVSRCQKFEFKRISLKDIISKLKTIAEAENIKIEEKALYAIARAASGSMRDAESILDQINSFAKSKISIDSVNSVLGLINQEILNEFTEYIIKKDTPSALALIDKIINEGKDGYQLLAGLIEYFRNILIAKQGKDSYKLIDLPQDDIELVSKQADNFTVEDILYILYTLINAQSTVRYAPSVRIPLDMLAVKLTRRESVVSLAEILQRISALGKRISENSKESNPIENSKETNQVKETKADNTPEHQDPANLYKLRDMWPQVMKKIKIEKIYVASCLEEAEIMEFKDNILTLGYAKNNKFHKGVLEKEQNKKLIESIISELLNTKIAIECLISDNVKPSNEGKVNSGSNKEKEENAPPQTTRESIKKALSDPIIQSALDIFDGNIMKFM